MFTIARNGIAEGCNSVSKGFLELLQIGHIIHCPWSKDVSGHWHDLCGYVGFVKRRAIKLPFFEGFDLTCLASILRFVGTFYGSVPIPKSNHRRNVDRELLILNVTVFWNSSWGNLSISKLWFGNWGCRANIFIKITFSLFYNFGNSERISAYCIKITC